MTMTVGGTSGLVFPDSSTQNTAATGFGFKNRIINGAMMIDQRNAGASVSNANGYTLDRFYLMRGNASSSPVFNVQQSTTVPSGFKNSLGITVGTSGAPGTTNYSCLYQRIEGANCADLDFGLATAKAVTLSFWVNCSVTGTFGIAFQNDATNRSYIASYTVNSANTWEYKTVTITGDTSGTWLTTNGTGIGIYWDIGIGTTQSTTAGSWQAGNYLGLTGGTKLSNTSGATFYITGVQLEKGSTATSFDYRPYGTELALCQRYYIRKTGVDGDNFNIGQVASATRGLFWEPWVMRSAPTINYANIVLNDVSVGPSVTGTAGITTLSSGISYALDAAGGGMTSGRSCRIRSSASGYIDFSAEL